MTAGSAAGALVGEMAIEPGAHVGDVMATTITVLDAATTVQEVRRFFEDDHVHLAILTDGDTVVSTLVRDDLAAAQEPGAPAAPHGRLQGRSVGPDDDLATVARRMLAEDLRRLVVLDAGGRLVGLLCLKRSRRGFCGDADIAARRGCR